MWGLLMVPLAIGFAIFSAKNAAMRGTGTKPFPEWMDKLFRLTFLLMYTSPVYLYFSWLIPSWLLGLLLLAYIPSYLDGSERFHGRPSEFCKNMTIWVWFKNRCNMSLIKTADLDPERQYILGMHPHGIMPFGSIINLSTNCNNASEVLKGIQIRALAASFCFYVPGYRDLLLSGGVMDAARYVARRVLAEGKSIMLVPGGATEALYANIGMNVIYIKNRKGFVKLALETGSSLVPVYSFNETDTYGIMESKSSWLKDFKVGFQAVLGE
jgi:2-acylglycerol O-acyltransferase 2